VNCSDNRSNVAVWRGKVGARVGYDEGSRVGCKGLLVGGRVIVATGYREGLNVGRFVGLDVTLGGSLGLRVGISVGG